MMRMFVFTITMSTFISICCAADSATSAPKAYGPVPTKNQLRWHATEYFGLICYGLNTYTGQGWGYGDVNPSLLNPSSLDTDQWARAAKDGGMRGLILVAKHHDGFCLWPSKTTKYTIAAAPWKDGKGDLLADMAKSCKKFGLRFGIYISPWDRNHAEYGREEYVKVFHEQWREVIEYDDDVFEIWLDGANGGSGWYGGAKERRKIPKDYYQFDKLYEMIKQRQPGTLFFNIKKKTDCIRWIYNESGVAPDPHWSRFSYKELMKDAVSKSAQKAKKNACSKGAKYGDIWVPAEADTPIHKGWYWAAHRPEKDFEWLLSTYYTSVGRGAILNLGLAPQKDGLLSQSSVNTLKRVKKHLDKTFAVNLLDAAAVTADNVRGKDKTYAVSQTLDKNTGTYWATDDGVNKASISIGFGKAVTFDHLLMQEHIALGQRVHKFKLEVQEADGTWKTAAEGATIGYKKIKPFEPCTASKARLTLETDAPCLTLATLGIYKGASTVQAPTIQQDKQGMVTLSVPVECDVYYAVGEINRTKSFEEGAVRFTQRKTATCTPTLQPGRLTEN